jgi:hypothetical protein
LLNGTRFGGRADVAHDPMAPASRSHERANWSGRAPPRRRERTAGPSECAPAQGLRPRPGTGSAAAAACEQVAACRGQCGRSVLDRRQVVRLTDLAFGIADSAQHQERVRVAVLAFVARGAERRSCQSLVGERCRPLVCRGVAHGPLLPNHLCFWRTDLPDNRFCTGFALRSTRYGPPVGLAAAIDRNELHIEYQPKRS